ncbi:MAG TPA: POTRA domain-containing protein [Kofleriaceae bacterium]|nr:POTRA domain-containing protein [Kofleriaceae bacterium]
MGNRRLACLAAVGVGSAACHHQRPAAVPGDTAISVASVDIQPRAGEQLAVDYEPLVESLGLRKGSLIRPERRFNPFRLAEDRRRIASYLAQVGRFDAAVSEPDLIYSDDHERVSVTWTVHEGPAYRIASVHLVGAPAGQEAMLRGMIPFGPGSPVDLATYRPLRRTMAEALQDEGYGHARVYSRAFVDRAARAVHWYYYVDAGPRTRIAAIAIEGNRNVPADLIRERLGLHPGDSYSTRAKRRAELALLDTGAFVSAVVLSDADIQTGAPEHPDTGGALAPEQIDGDGNLVPRALPADVSLKVTVVEAPSRQLRLEAGVEGDPTRVDSFAGARVWLRNLFGPQHHLVLEGSVGYGWLVDDDSTDPTGLYGNALVRHVHPGWLTRRLDLRTTAQYRDVVYPSAQLREVSAGPGVRVVAADQVFVDVDLLYRRGRTLDFGPFDAMAIEDHSLAGDDLAQGGELDAALVVDRRDDGLEPTRGYFLALRGALSPGGALGTHRWAQVGPEARGFLPIGGAWSLAARASSGWVVAGEDGAPLGARLFGGGAFGMRGFGRDRLSPSACVDTMDPAGGCEEALVGGMSLLEGSLEARYLPFRKQIGLAAFADLGGAGARANPLSSGVSTAFGVGGRLRTWYVPISIDLSYRLLEESELTSPDTLDPYLVFFRIGEAF